MDDPSATLLLTRPKPQSDAFLAECETAADRRLPVVISPLMRIVDVNEIPDLDAFDTLVLTSGNGVARLGKALQGRRVLTVGHKTAELAQGYGADAKALGENVEAFLANGDPITGRVLVCRGLFTRGGVTQALAKRGAKVEEAVLYEQVSQPLNDAARRLLTGQQTVVAPVFSPRSAELLSANEITAPIIVLAISSATAEAWTGPGKVRVADQPDAHHMQKLVQATF